MYVNHSENIKYYKSKDSIPCACDDCVFYITQIEREYPRVCSYLRTMDIDPLRPFELVLLDFDKYMECDMCLYIVFGNCEDSYIYQLDEVTFCKVKSHLDTHFLNEKAHFVIGFYPIHLEKRYS